MWISLNFDLAYMWGNGVAFVTTVFGSLWLNCVEVKTHVNVADQESIIWVSWTTYWTIKC